MSDSSHCYIQIMRVFFFFFNGHSKSAFSGKEVNLSGATLSTTTYILYV